MLFSDIEAESKTLDISEVSRFCVDFGLSPKFLSSKDVEAVCCCGRSRLSHAWAQ